MPIRAPSMVLAFERNEALSQGQTGPESLFEYPGSSKSP